MITLRLPEKLLKLMRERTLDLCFYPAGRGRTALVLVRLDKLIVRCDCQHTSPEAVGVELSNGLATLLACLEAGVSSPPEKL